MNQLLWPWTGTLDLVTKAYLYKAPRLKVTIGRKHVSMLVLAAGTKC